MLAMMDEVRIQEGTESRPGTVLQLVKYRSRGTGMG